MNVVCSDTLGIKTQTKETLCGDFSRINFIFSIKL